MVFNFNVFGAITSGLGLFFFYTFFSVLLPSSVYCRLQGTLEKAERLLSNTGYEYNDDTEYLNDFQLIKGGLEGLQARALCLGHRVDHLTWIGAEVKALACGLSWQIFRLDCEVSILLVRFSKAKQAGNERRRSNTAVTSSYARVTNAVERGESSQGTLAESEDDTWPDDVPDDGTTPCVDKIPMVDIGTCQLKDSNQDLYVAPLPLVDILEYPSLASKHSPGIRSPYDSLSPDKRALVERRVRSAAKVMRRQILQNRKESAMVDSVEKRIPHLCSAGGRETAELNQFQAVYEILRQPASTERRRRPTKQSSICNIKDFTLQNAGKLDMVFGPVVPMHGGVTHTRSRAAVA